MNLLKARRVEGGPGNRAGTVSSTQKIRIRAAHRLAVCAVLPRGTVPAPFPGSESLEITSTESNIVHRHRQTFRRNCS